MLLPLTIANIRSNYLLRLDSAIIAIRNITLEPDPKGLLPIEYINTCHPMMEADMTGLPERTRF